MDAISTAALKSWRSLQGVIAVLTEEQVRNMLEHEMDNLKRGMIVVRLHQRYCALRDARERGEIMTKMGVIK
jgi:anti-sigma regulatory factor (Ser/Thr protein kinase)